ncbi:MAG: DsbA family oxidoreductase [Thermoleophilia bacterium]
MSEGPMRIDVWSDIACPWCYIGKRRFEEGARRFAESTGRPVEVEYHAFELAPDTPVDFEGSEVDFLVHHKGMSEERVRSMLDQMTETARGEGLEYDFAGLRHTKTFRAHELLHHAKAKGLQEPMKERLLRAYFTEGRHLGHVDQLADLAAEVGLDRDEVVAVLEEGRYSDAVLDDMAVAQRLGIRGVPFYVIDQRYGVSGAQPAELFEEALNRAAALSAQEDAAP